MARVQINNNQVIVDGVDMSRAILADGFRVEFATGEDRPVAHVHMVVLADEGLEADLADAVIHAMRADA